MRTLGTFTFLLMLTACGTPDTGAHGNSSKAPNRDADGPAFPSLYLDMVRDLPTCSETVYGALAYVKETATFHACSDEGWVEVSLPSSAKGERGEAGRAVSAAANTWTDPVTGDEWLIGAATVHPATATSCTGGFGVPTLSEMKLAIGRGVLVHSVSLGGPNTAWYNRAPESNGSGGWFNYYLDAAASEKVSTSLNQHGVFCRKAAVQ